MKRFVLDASTAFEYLIRTPTGITIDSIIAGNLPATAGLMDVEVISIMRRNVRLKLLTPVRAAIGVKCLQEWPIERFNAQKLDAYIWSLGDNFSAYDAFYVAVAAHIGGTLITLDRKLSSAPKMPCAVIIL